MVFLGQSPFAVCWPLFSLSLTYTHTHTHSHSITLPCAGEEIVWTPWGLVSGLLWVPGATFGILAVQWAGMAAAEGTWSSVIVIVNFVWGILVFQEGVKSLTETCAAFVTLTIGLVGMSTFSSPESTTTSSTSTSSSNTTITTTTTSTTTTTTNSSTVSPSSPDATTTTEEKDRLLSSSYVVEDEEEGGLQLNRRRKRRTQRNYYSDEEDVDQQTPGEGTAPPPSSMTTRSTTMVKRTVSSTESSNNNHHNTSNDNNSHVHSDDDTTDEQYQLEQDHDGKKKLEGLHHRRDGIVGLVGGVGWMTRRQLGIAAAAINGLWGGTSLVPMHYAAQAGFAGARYYFSYAAGAMMVNGAVLVLLFAYRLVERGGSFREAQQAMPKWHFRQLWWPGLLSGVLFSVGMFGSIVAVGFLGQGIGNSFVQCKILVSGLWGILYYQEIRGATTIAKWFASAAVGVTGILLLSYEHQHLAHH